MPPPIPVVLAPYDDAWPQAEARYAQVPRALGSNLAAVHHVGSTSVAGLAAKPIIDLVPVVWNLSKLDEQTLQLTALGFEWQGELGMSGRPVLHSIGRAWRPSRPAAFL